MSAIFILLAVGALIGTWNMAGTIPTVVDYGVRILNPTIFFLTTSAICAAVGMVTGKFVDDGGYARRRLRRHVQSDGRLRGDRRRSRDLRRLLRRQDDPALGDDHPRAAARRPRPYHPATHPKHVLDSRSRARGQPAHLPAVLGLRSQPASVVSADTALKTLESEFNITALNLLPLALLVVFTLKKVAPFLAILGSALFAGILACFTQWTIVQAFVADPSLGPLATGMKAIYAAMATGFVSNTGNSTIDQLFSRGGMASLLTTVWLVLAALSFAAIMEHAGFLERLLRLVVARAPTRGRLIAAVNASGIGLNVIAGDQYVAVVLPARMFRGEFERRGLAPQVLSRAGKDSGTVTSVLVPWNTCGAYISGVLGVSTAAYLPYCYFNFLSPILDIAYGFLGFKVPHLAVQTEAARVSAGSAQQADPRVGPPV